VSFDDWILALHLLSAFGLASSIVLFTITLVALRRTDRPSQVVALGTVAKIGEISVIAGSIGTIVFGIWLALSLDAYSIFDFWIIAAIVLWVIGFETGRRSGVEMQKGFDRSTELVNGGKADEPSAELAADLRSGQLWLLHWLATGAVFLVLLDMIWKPWA